MQPVVAYVIAAGLLVLAVYFGIQQLLTLARLRARIDLSTEDRAYVRQQAWVRLACSSLLVLLALMVAGAYTMGLEQRASDLGRTLQEQRQKGEDATPDQERFLKFYGAYWITVLVILMVVVLLAALDIWAIRRYGRRQLLQLHADHKASVKEQLAAMRTERNGHA
jgi:hypothetical protein